MTEPTITCPKCKTEIRLTESLAAPLIETTRRDYEKLLAQKAIMKQWAKRDEQIERVIQATVGMYGDLDVHTSDLLVDVDRPIRNYAPG